MTDGHITVVNGAHNGNDDAPYAQQRSALQGGITGQIHAVQPVDISARVPLTRKVLVFRFVLHIRQRGGHGFGGLIGEPQSLERLLRGERVADAKPHDDLPLTVCVPRIYDGIYIGTVAQIFDSLKLLFYAGVNAFFVVGTA